MEDTRNLLDEYKGLSNEEVVRRLERKLGVTRRGSVSGLPQKKKDTRAQGYLLVISNCPNHLFDLDGGVSTRGDAGHPM